MVGDMSIFVCTGQVHEVYTLKKEEQNVDMALYRIQLTIHRANEQCQKYPLRH
jgi:hypothetical protein